jgi:hypothetical protein
MERQNVGAFFWAEKIERQASSEPRAEKTRRMEIEIGGVVQVSADISEADLRHLLRGRVGRRRPDLISNDRCLRLRLDATSRLGPERHPLLARFNGSWAIEKVDQLLLLAIVAPSVYVFHQPADPTAGADYFPCASPVIPITPCAS